MVTKVGNLKVYCNGKIFVGPDWKSLVVSFLLILLPSILYLAFIASKLGPDIFWLGLFLILFNLTMLALTGLSNPGVIPRRPAPTGPNLCPPTRTKDYQINGYTVSTKYCATCQIYRVPRCSHCAMSDNCVEKFDHYCPWVGTCIGRRNYRFFLLFVFSGTFLCLLVCASSLSRLIEVSDEKNDEFDTALKNEPVAIALVIYTFGAVWFLGGLSVFHTYLVMTNQTTYEHIRRRFGQHGNPYNKGVFMNLFEACCQPNPPYDWENDGSQIQLTHSTTRALELPQGGVFDHTVIAMEQAVKERAEKAKRENSRRGSEGGSCSYAMTDTAATNVIRDAPGIELEYQDSFGSSTSSLDGRQMGMTMQSRPPELSPFIVSKKSNETRRADLETAHEQDLEEEVKDVDESNTSLENPASSARSATDSVARLSNGGVPPSSNSKDGSGGDKTSIATTTRARSHHRSYTREYSSDPVKRKPSRYSETELSTARSSARRSTNPFASYADQAGEVEVDLNPLEVATTLSSLTSNATSEMSTHKTDRHRKNEHNVMSMEEIMRSHRSFSEMSRSKQSQQNTAKSGGTQAKGVRFGSDSLSKLRSWRTSGENVITNIRAFIRRPSRNSREENVDTVTAADQVLVEVDEEKNKDIDVDVDKQALSQLDPNVSNDDRSGQKSWVPQLPVLGQKKYSELKETTSLPEGSQTKSISEDVVSHEWVSTNSKMANDAHNLQSSEIVPDDRPPHKINMSQLTEEEYSGEKVLVTYLAVCFTNPRFTKNETNKKILFFDQFDLIFANITE